MLALMLFDISIQCFDTIVWGQEGHSFCKKIVKTSSPQRYFVLLTWSC